MSALLPAKLSRAYSPITGIVGELEECLALPDEPPLFRYAASVGRSQQTPGDREHLGSMGGCSPDRRAAAASAVGEAIERYSASTIDPARVRVATEDDLDGPAASVRDFRPFAAGQYDDPDFPFAAPSSDLPTPWIRGFRIRDGERYWLPAELVALGDLREFIHQPTSYTTSTGTACAETLDDALVRGLCEVLERDAFMLTWMRGVMFPRLDLTGHVELVQIERRFFGRSRLRCSAIDLSRVHGVPTVLAVVRAQEGVLGALGVGAGAAPTIEEAWRKAVSEACSTRLAAAKLAVTRPGRTFDRRQDVASFDDHIQYYALAERIAPAAFLDASDCRSRAEEIAPLAGGAPGDWIDALLACVRRAGVEAYAVDLTAPDVRDLGLVVAKVLVPGLCMLDVAESARFLGPARLWDWQPPQDATTSLPLGTLNPYPHPFP